jgi:hypothetical protein
MNNVINDLGETILKQKRNSAASAVTALLRPIVIAIWHHDETNPIFQGHPARRTVDHSAPKRAGQQGAANTNSAKP